ncbi:unnamed protein product [Laminaria digitata]
MLLIEKGAKTNEHQSDRSTDSRARLCKRKRILHVRQGTNRNAPYCGVRGVEGGGVRIVMHGLKTVDRRIPTMPGQSTSGFHRRGRHCLHQERSAVRCLFGESHEG